MKGKPNGERGKVKSVSRAIDIIDRIRQQEGAGVSELAEEFDVAKSTIHAHLATLHDAGYLVKQGGEYQIGTKFLEIGEYARSRRKEYLMAASTLRELAQQSGERAQFGIAEMGRAVILYLKRGKNAVNTGVTIGTRPYLHTNAIGKAILSQSSDAEVAEFIDRWGLPRVTQFTITDEDELRATLAEIRDRGYAVNNQENVTGLSAIGVPVMKDEDVIGGISLSGPSNRLKGERLHDELADLLRGKVNELELSIKYS